ncbi:hypothetical protein FHS21_001300 [Phyllobacterium trifolii]|uniref:Uncharacterized protein n=1 Tax=Phyllobacterium trifolii TaxID=300193 RepID=A0A839U9H9_9HYPH|nr:hypothetical protein [Phyllobacterium trifolii]MBB3144899.1 hypothetical protein [Phyllobacterium trifolii]
MSTAIAISLYLLGLIGAVAAVGRDVAPGPREWAIIVIWPVGVFWSVITGLAAPLMGKLSK